LKMGAVDPDKACEVGLARAWYRSAVAMAVIGGAFSMAASYASGRIGETRLEKRLEELKAQLGDRAANEEAIIAEIRRLDVEFRQMRFRRLGFSRTGRYILLASAAVFVVGVKLAGAIKARVPRRKPAGEPCALVCRGGAGVGLCGGGFSGADSVCRAEGKRRSGGFLSAGRADQAQLACGCEYA